MANKHFFPEPSYNLIEQKNFIIRQYPNSRAVIRQGVLYCYIKIQPSSLSCIYDVRIEYRMGKAPKIWAKDPFMNKENSHMIPHKYRVDLDQSEIQLCLYLPRKKEWTKAVDIAQTIIPWASEWLFFYEIWKATGEWKGGGEHPK